MEGNAEQSATELSVCGSLEESVSCDKLGGGRVKNVFIVKRDAQCQEETASRKR